MTDWGIRRRNWQLFVTEYEKYGYTVYYIHREILGALTLVTESDDHKSPVKSVLKQNQNDNVFRLEEFILNYI